MKYVHLGLVVIFIFLITVILSIISLSLIRNHNYNHDNRDYNYEHYCDSIYIVNPDYYYDVLVETDEFQSYIQENGQWWKN